MAKSVNQKQRILADVISALLPVVSSCARTLRAPVHDVDEVRSGIELIRKHLNDSFQKLGIGSTSEACGGVSHEPVDIDQGFQRSGNSKVQKAAATSEGESDNNRTALLIRCTRQEAQSIRNAARAERHTISDYVVQSVITRIAIKEKCMRRLAARNTSRADGG